VRDELASFFFTELEKSLCGRTCCWGGSGLAVARPGSILGTLVVWGSSSSEGLLEPMVRKGINRRGAVEEAARLPGAGPVATNAAKGDWGGDDGDGDDLQRTSSLGFGNVGRDVFVTGSFSCHGQPRACTLFRLLKPGSWTPPSLQPRELLDRAPRPAQVYRTADKCTAHGAPFFRRVQAAKGRLAASSTSQRRATNMQAHMRAPLPADCQLPASWSTCHYTS